MIPKVEGMSGGFLAMDPTRLRASAAAGKCPAEKGLNTEQDEGAEERYLFMESDGCEAPSL